MDDLLRDIESFDWNKGNIDKNWIKHKVSNLEAEEVFLDESGLLGKDEKHSTKEPRYKFLGLTKNFRYLSIFFTIREEKIRIISARSMNKKERNKYDQEKIK